MKWKQKEITLDRYILKKNGEYRRLENVDDVRDNYNEGSFTVRYIEEKDNKGIKIFEADILKVNLRKSVIHGYIYYNGAISAYTLNYKNFGTPIHEITGLLQWSEKFVIGNVFQNPELVKKYKLKF